MARNYYEYILKIGGHKRSRLSIKIKKEGEKITQRLNGTGLTGQGAETSRDFGFLQERKKRG